MAKNQVINPAIIVVALVIIFTLYKSGFLASFITTCNNIEPDTATGFKTLLADNLNITSESNAQPITITVTANNNSQDYTFNGKTYTGQGMSINVYDTNPLNCEAVISTLLKSYSEQVIASFTPVLMRPDYNNSETYYVLNEGTYTEITAAPIVGQEYYKLVEGDTYVKMTTPYMTTPPSLSSDPYKFYTPVGYKTISGKLIDDVLYWCSNNQNTLLTTNKNVYETMNSYGPAVIQCQTTWVNDTKTVMERCLQDEAVWAEEGTCECPEGETYTPGNPCVVEAGQHSTTTSNNNDNTGVSVTTKEEPKNNTLNMWVGIGLVTLLIGYFVYNQFLKKKVIKGFKKRKLF